MTSRECLRISLVGMCVLGLMLKSGADEPDTSLWGREIRVDDVLEKLTSMPELTVSAVARGRSFSLVQSGAKLGRLPEAR